MTEIGERFPEPEPIIDCKALATGSKKFLPVFAAFLTIASVAWVICLPAVVLPKLNTWVYFPLCGKAIWVPEYGIAASCVCIFGLLLRGLLLIPKVGERKAKTGYGMYGSGLGLCSGEDGTPADCFMRFLFDGIPLVAAIALGAYGMFAVLLLNTQDKRCEHYPYAWWALAGGVSSFLWPVLIIWQNYVLRSATSSEQDRPEVKEQDRPEAQEQAA
mmetsp:Transcript_2705/g.6107  ORF Transcript_2705/g.6107 Transcript_2705/m.6107 type:complete len:216 (-) Transcript_2705:307-954(-)